MWLFLWLSVSHLTLDVCRGQGATQTVTFSMRKLAFSTNQFGIDLYRALNATDENVALCPFCVGSSLAMMLLGAEGPSAMALKQALYLWGLRPHEIHLAYHDLIAHLGLNLTPLDELPGFEGRRSHADDNVLKIINNVYIQRHFAVHYPFQFMLHRYYNTSVYPLDFVLSAEQSTRYINAYFRRHTADRVTQVLSRVPSPSTNLLLLGALYFRGTLDMDMGTAEEEGRRAGEGPFTVMQARRARVRSARLPQLHGGGGAVPRWPHLLAGTAATRPVGHETPGDQAERPEACRHSQRHGRGHRGLSDAPDRRGTNAGQPDQGALPPGAGGPLHAGARQPVRHQQLRLAARHQRHARRPRGGQGGSQGDAAGRRSGRCAREGDPGQAFPVVHHGQRGRTGHRHGQNGQTRHRPRGAGAADSRTTLVTEARNLEIYLGILLW